MKHLIWLVLGFTLIIPHVMATSYSNETDMPDAMQHMVKAPEIDFISLRDPFASYLVRIAPVAKTQSTQAPHIALKAPQIQPSNREREKLESYDLESLRLVAIFSMSGERVAMVEDSTSKGYIIRRGSYLGKNNGQIEKITDDTLFLVEEMINPAGDVIDRQVSLTLNEVNE